MYAKMGRISPSPSGTGINPLRADQMGALITSTAGDYKDIALGGRQYFAFQGSSSVALYTATSAVGIQIYNPASSGINVVINKWAVIVWATSATMTGMVLAIAGAATNPPASLVAPDLTGRSMLSATTGLPVGAAIATKTCTLAAAPVRVWNLFHNTAAINTVGAEQMSGDLQGMFVFAPGTVAVIGALGAAGVTVDISVGWEEVPVGL